MATLVDLSSFRTLLEWQIRQGERYGERFVVAMVEIGACGPEALPGALDLTLRRCDLISKAEDDRVAVLLTRAVGETVQSVSDRLWRHLRDSAPKGEELFVGAVSYPADGSCVETLLEAASTALARSRESGANPHISVSLTGKPLSGSSSRILIVDDDAGNRKLLRSSLFESDRDVVEAQDGSQALALVDDQEFDLVLLDVMMPGLDGFEVCRRLKTRAVSEDIPVILITALDDTESKIKGITAGADDFITKPFHTEEVRARAASLIRLRKARGKTTTLENVMLSLAAAIEAKDSYTQGHTDRVSRLATALGDRAGLSADEREGLQIGGILHDVGKIGIPEHILNKEGPLTDEEWEIIRKHPRVGVEICESFGRTLGQALDVILHHHEKLDGSSYPDGLAGDQISTVSRIMAVVDIYDALTTDRPYRKALSEEEAFAILREDVEKGKLDARVVEYLVDEVRRG